MSGYSKKNDHNQRIDELVRSLRSAADELEKSDFTPEEADAAIGEVQSCCGTCTGISSIPPCANACIKISPLM